MSFYIYFVGVVAIFLENKGLKVSLIGAYPYEFMGGKTVKKQSA